MVTDVRTRAEMHGLIDALSEAEWEDFVDVVNTYLDGAELSEVEIGMIDEARREYAAGRTVPRESLKRASDR